jgi:hypothetical protein
MSYNSLEFAYKKGIEAFNLMKSFCRGSRGTVFSKRVPLAAGGKNENENSCLAL